MATKLFKDLKVADLKRELEERELDTTGTKSRLQSRLKEALESGGHDPEVFQFEIPHSGIDLNVLVSKMDENSRKIDEKLDENSRKMNDKLDKHSKVLEEKFYEKANAIKEEMHGNCKILGEQVLRLEDKLLEQEDKIMQMVEERMARVQLSTTVNQPTKDKTTELLERRMTQLRFSPTVTYPVGEINREMKEEKDPVATMKVKPPTFDGKVPWSTYYKQFEAAATANGWTDKQKTVSLVVALRGDALNILQTVPGNQQNNYGLLVSRLEMRYGDAHLQQVYHAQVKSRIQNNEESLQEFEADIARLVRLAYPTAPDSFLEQLTVQTFVDGLRDGETQQSLRLARPRTADDALAHALEFEAAKQASRGHGRIRTVAEESEGSQDRLEELVLRMLWKEDRRRSRPEAWGPRCWNCGERGHMRRRCPKPRNDQPSEN